MTDLAMGADVIRINPHQSRHVEGDAEARLPMLKEIFEAAIGVVGGPEAGKLSHRPKPASIHRWIDAASIGELSRMAQIILRRPVLQVIARVHTVDVEPREGSEPRFAFLHRS